MIIFLFFFTYQQPLEEAFKAMGTDLPAAKFERLEWSLYTKDRLKIVEKLMKDPFYVFQWEKEKKGNIPINVVYAYRTMCKDLGTEINTKTDRDYDLKSAVDEIIELSGKIEKAYSPIDVKRLERILLFIQDYFTEEDTTQPSPGDIAEQFNFSPDTSIKTNTDTVVRWMKEMNRDYLLKLNGQLLSIVYNLSKTLKKHPPETTFTMDTDYGKVSIGGKGNDTYNGNYLLIIDLDGDDQYILKGAVLKKTVPVQIIIDLNGDDSYKSKGYTGPGGAICGTSILMDLSGNDNYSTGHISLGTGFLGTGILFDSTGNDHYNSGILSIGAGILGTGILYDRSGMDTYRGLLYSEGFAGILGYGLLYDGKGSDIYSAGGFYFHKPLLPETYESLSQGFSIGERPDYGGGVGILYDAEGNDCYIGGTYVQGAAYWFSAGFLFDDSGEDFYNATEYAQGAGIHLAFGYLHDLKGNDHYFSRHGPSQGEGHDFAVGILIDSSGYDWYTVSGGLGIGLTNSLGIFIDGEGNDIYNITEEKEGKPFGIGDVNRARGFCGIGVFLDLSGDDIYPSGRYGNDRSWSRYIYGFGMDKNSRNIVPEYKQLPVPELSKMEMPELFKIASEWGVGENKKRVKKAREELARRGKESLDYIFREKIGTKDGLEMRAIRAVLKENPAKSRDYLLKALNDTNWIVRRNACGFIADIKLDDAEDSLLKYMKLPENKKILRSFIYALGRLKSKKAIPEIEKYLNAKSEDLRIVSLRALSSIGDTTAIKDIIPLLNDPFTTVRSACVFSLEKFGKDLSHCIAKYWETYPPLLYIGGIVATKEKGEEIDRIKNTLFDALEKKDDNIRMMAVKGLSFIKDSAVKTTFQLRVWKEKNPVIRDIMKEYLVKDQCKVKNAK